LNVEDCQRAIHQGLMSLSEIETSEPLDQFAGATQQAAGRIAMAFAV
jgi:hypothetical protein